LLDLLRLRPQVCQLVGRSLDEGGDRIEGSLDLVLETALKALPNKVTEVVTDLRETGTSPSATSETADRAP
jgi:hypothetical protein